MRDEARVNLGQIRIERQHLHSDFDMPIELKRGSSISFALITPLALQSFLGGLLSSQKDKKYE